MFSRNKKSKFVDNQSRRLYRAAQKTPEDIFVTYKSSYKGLSQKEVNERLKLFGKNNITDTREPSSFYILIQAFRSSINWSTIFGSNPEPVFTRIPAISFLFEKLFHRQIKFQRMKLQCLCALELKIEVNVLKVLNMLYYETH